MTRENYGKWHIDHIRPCSSFDLSKPEEQSICFHYSNLMPLWAEENLKKGSKLNYEENKRGQEWGKGWDGKSRVPDKTYKENYDSIDWSYVKKEKKK